MGFGAFHGFENYFCKFVVPRQNIGIAIGFGLLSNWVPSLYIEQRWSAAHCISQVYS